MVEENKHEAVKSGKPTSAILAVLCVASLVSIAGFSYFFSLETLLTFAVTTALVLAVATSLAFAAIMGGIVLFESWLDYNIN